MTNAVSRLSGRAALAAIAVLLALAGCAGYSPKGLQPGASEADVTRQMGPPTGRFRRVHSAT